MTYYMITNRNVEAGRLGNQRADLSFWINNNGNATDFAAWTGPIPADDFKRVILDATKAFPDVPMEEHAEQKHVTLFIHGFNNSWDDAAQRYKSLCDGLFADQQSMGLCILFTWPSNGQPFGYLPDREDARATAPDLAAVLNEFYDWLLVQQRLAARNPDAACKAKTSIIAHSMGNYVLQKAMQYSWSRNNQPLLISLVNQLLMVAADVDNDLFDQNIQKGDGAAMANLTYRITALFSGRDPILGVSAGLKHFGKRRLGRSGLDFPRVPDNVWQIDCSNLLVGPDRDVHSAYFDSPKTIAVMRDVLRGFDRKRIEQALGLI